MKYRTLGRTGLEVSVIGFGGIPIQRVNHAAAKEIMEKALEAKINFFDTARAYSDSEEKMGQVLGKHRDEVIIATKSLVRSKEKMARDIQISLENLQVDTIDLYQIHNVRDVATLERVMSPGGALEALLEAKQKGLVKHIGVTSHIRDVVKAAMKHEVFETVQFPLNVVEAEGAEEILDMARKTNTGTIIMKPLAGGALTNADLALRFLLSYPVDTIIPGMDTVEQVLENTGLVDKQPLSEEELAALQAEGERLGDTFCRRCEYCQPCPQGINIPMVFLQEAYYTRYGLTDWASSRYASLPAKVEDCSECGECETKCPYDLPIRDMLKEAEKTLTS
ncbi:MAG TPA: aldo/keto reductase [Firmicutes bacterium]|nr:aldo/keto reductase [Bacillota bacterium]